MCEDGCLGKMKKMKIGRETMKRMMMRNSICLRVWAGFFTLVSNQVFVVVVGINQIELKQKKGKTSHLHILFGPLGFLKAQNSMFIGYN